MNGSGQWSVRTLVAIPCDAFIVDLAGEMLVDNDIATRINHYRTTMGSTGIVWCFTHTTPTPSLSSSSSPTPSSTPSSKGAAAATTTTSAAGAITRIGWSHVAMAIDVTACGNVARFLRDACAPNLITFMVRYLSTYSTLID
jgi:hypothetical protein